MKQPRFELFYSTGGHGGPYVGFENAVEAAKRYLHGCQGVSFVRLVRYSTRLEAAYRVERDDAVRYDGMAHY